MSNFTNANQPINHGLSHGHLEIIKKILKPWAHQINRVALFGSRATGKYRDNSDIDLVLYSNADDPLDTKIMDRIWTLFNESSLPYKVDINAYELITYPPFKHHIDEVNRVLFVGVT